MAKMTPEETQRYQAALRKAPSEVSKHLQLVEDFSSESTNREAYRKARGLCHLKYIYKGQLQSTRLTTESHTEHLEALKMCAEERVGPEEIGGPGEPAPMGMGGEEMPLEESKNISKDEITRLIIEEWTNAYLKDRVMKINKNTLKDLVMEELSKLPEQAPVAGGAAAELPPDPGQKKRKRKPRKEKVIGKTKSGRRIRRARRWAPIKKGKYPHNKFQVYSVTKVVDGKKTGDDKASFDKFYKAVLNNPEARRQLGCRGKGYKNCRRSRRGGMDYTWGDKHADAYATLNQGSRVQGKTEIKPPTEKALQTGPKKTVPGMSHLTGVGKSHLDIKDPKAKAIFQYQQWSQKAERAKEIKEKWSNQMASLQQKLNVMAGAGQKGSEEYNKFSDKHDELHRKWTIISKQIPKLQALAQKKAQEAKDLGRPKKKLAGPAGTEVAEKGKDLDLAKQNLKHMESQLADKIKKHKADPMNQPALPRQIVKLKKDIKHTRQSIKFMISGHN